jgi:hypothetical protein
VQILFVILLKALPLTVYLSQRTARK